MSEKINPQLPTYFYDDRSKYDWMLKLTEILFTDETICVCKVECTNPEVDMSEEKIVFNIADRTVVNMDYHSWYATNDIDWAISESERLRARAEDY